MNPTQVRPSQNNPEGLFRTVPWEEILGGQTVMVKKNEDAPADILVMYTSNENGVAFVDTMALDGETNLKEKVTCLDDP